MPLQLAGVHAARQLTQEFRGTRSVMVVDASVIDRTEVLSGCGFLWHETVEAPVTLQAASILARRLRQDGVERVLAVGGGNTMDLAKLGVAIATDPLVGDILKRPGTGSGVVVLPRPLASHIDYCCVPTTFGTGAEVNPAACYETVAGNEAATVAYRTKNLVMLEGLKPQAVAYDPEFLHAPPWLAAEGLLEPAVRLLTALVESESSLNFSDSQGRRLLAEAGTNLADGRQSGFILSGQAQMAAALLSAESHAGWSLRGRGAAPSSLWFLANEMSMAIGLRKNQASALLLGPWMDAVMKGLCVWGDQQKLEELWPLLAAGATGEGASALMGTKFGDPATNILQSSWGSRPVDLAEQLSASTLRRFGRGKPMKKHLRREELTELFLTAIQTAIGREVGV